MRKYLDRRGTTAIEYALMAGIFTMALAAAVGSLRGGIADLWMLASEVDPEAGPL